jgi:GntR family transcriptional regulator, arabinose operon transcriptional repressor
MTTISLSPRKKVTKSVREWIKDGIYTSGNRLPTEMEISCQLKVARGTVRTGLMELVKEGILEQRRGVGTFVGETAPSRSKHRTIVWMTPLVNTRYSLYDRIMEGIESITFDNDLALIFCNLGNSAEKTEIYIRKLKSMDILGVVFAPLIKDNYYEINSRIIDQLEQAGLKYVVVDAPVAQNGIIRGNFVGSDGYSAMREVIKYLVKQKHTCLASIRVFPGVYTSDQRFNGIVDQFAVENIAVIPEYHLSVEDIPLEQQGRAEIRKLMMLDKPPTAITCTHDFIAKNVIEELCEMNLRVPEDVSVFGFDDVYFSEFIGLSTVRQPFYEIGRKAAEILLGAIKNNHSGNRQEFLTCEIIPRKTCALLKD